MSKRYTGNIISPTPQVPANNYGDTPASGVWGMYEVADLIKRGLWPSLANINPSKFVENIFSTYVYTGNDATRSITNGIDLAGEGGLVWIKQRSALQDHQLFDNDTVGGTRLHTNNTNVSTNSSQYLSAFNSNGFSIGTNSRVNQSGQDYASWTFRKVPKFFDIVTYTGTGSAQTISHNLGSVPGVIIAKRTSSIAEWRVYHRSLGYTKYLALQNTDASTTDSAVWQAAPTSSVFSVGSDNEINAAGSTYVAYLFAHNNNDGEFGVNADQDIIKCGSYTGNSSGENDDNGTEINLGFEPQWILIKSSTWGSGDWQIFDAMRGITARPTTTSRDGDDGVLFPNRNNAEDGASSFLRVTPTGFKLESDNFSVNSSSHSYIYIAIRRGPMAVPTAATDVFAIDTGDGSSNPAFNAGFPVDFAFYKDKANIANWIVGSRLTQARYINTNTTSAESTLNNMMFDYPDHWYSGTRDTNQVSWMWKRAPNYFDVVAYTGNGTAGRTVSHNLDVAPEMIWVKDRSSTNEWAVYHSGADATAPEDYRLYLNTSAARVDSVNFWNDTAPTNSNFTVGNGSRVNASSDTYIAYLFASLSGVSKVGSYTGNGTNQTINCGFSAGARFILIKRTDSSGDWYVWDTERGIVAGNDPHLSLNTTAAQVTTDDSIDPVSSGFAVNQVTATNINVSSATYIFYAIA